MNVIVLGASSMIGAEMAAEFAPGNRLLLVGRHATRLEAAARGCRERGAAAVGVLACDLRQELSRAAGEVLAWEPDLIINAASASSRLRDDSIPPEKLPEFVQVDLVAPLELVRRALAARRSLGVIFVSSVLAGVRSPRRVVYSSLKRIQEQALRSLQASQPEMRLLIVRVGKMIPPDAPTPAAARLARAVRLAYARGKQNVLYGAEGRLLHALFHLQPVLFGVAVEAGRLARRSAALLRGASRPLGRRKAELLFWAVVTLLASQRAIL